jgi:hypothetical protein
MSGDGVAKFLKELGQGTDLIQWFVQMLVSKVTIADM